jgi:glycosyltransferase involved in cell wall biosynthesis
MQKVSIIVPCFNEEVNIPIFIQKINQALINQSDWNYEVIIVDGFSSDNTFKLGQEAVKSVKNENIKIVQRDKKYGYGADISYGLSLASGSILAWTHADLQTDPADILKGLNFFKGKDLKGVNFIVKGKRKNRKFLSWFFTFAMQIFTFLVLRKYLDDINAQPKIFTRNFYEKYFVNPPSDFSVDLFLLYNAKKNNYKIADFPVFFHNRQFGEAKGGEGSWKNRIKLIKRTVKYILKLKKN